METMLELLKAPHVGVREARLKLSDYLDAQAPAILTVSGKPRKILVPYNTMIDLLERLSELEKCRPTA